MLSYYDSIMAQLLVRNLDDAVVERLKLRARSRGMSLEQEVRTILTTAAQAGRAEIARHLEALRAEQRPGSVSVVDLIREDRDR
jgi:plasmid stability protein